MWDQSQKSDTPTWDTQRKRFRRDAQHLRERLGGKPTSRPNPSKPVPKSRIVTVHAYPPPRAQLAQYAVARLNPGQEGREDQHAPTAAPIDNRHGLAHMAWRMPSSLVQGQIGGLRGDPFNACPISTQGHVTSAFDYFAEVYAPFAIRPSLFKTYFHTLLHDEMYFEQTIAFAIAAENHRRVLGGHLPRTVIQHTNNAITLLRKRLLANDTSDPVILTIIQQGAIQHMINDTKACGVHVRAVEELVAVRGGLECLGWDGYVATRVRQFLSMWNMMQTKEGTVSLVGLTQGGFTYPTHPFPAGLSRKVARFPKGFRESALRRELSVQFINYLDLTLQWERDGNGKIALKISSKFEIIDMPKLLHVERLLATAVQAYMNFAERTVHARLNQLMEQSVQRQVHVLSALSEQSNECDRDLHTWVCLMTRATTSEETDAWKWANTWLCSIDVSTQEEEKLGRLFLPVPSSRVHELQSEDQVDSEVAV